MGRKLDEKQSSPAPAWSWQPWPRPLLPLSYLELTMLLQETWVGVFLSLGWETFNKHEGKLDEVNRVKLKDFGLVSVQVL